MAIAVFDVDGTLVGGAGTERGFFGWLLRRGYLGPRQLAAFLWFNVRWFAVYGRHTFKKNKAYLTGLGETVVEQAAVEFVEDTVRGNYYLPCINRVRSHLAAGDHVILLTGTLWPIATAIARSLGIEDAIATRCDIHSGFYTSAPPLIHPFGEEKRVLLDNERARLAAPHVQVFAYSDACHDIALLESVDTPVCVRPDRRLRAHAAACLWDVLDGALRNESAEVAPDCSGEG